MRRVCAWCKKELGASNIDDAPITHGICSDCSLEILSYMAKPLKNLLDQFSDPVFLVSSDVRILSTNSAGLSLLGKKSEDVEGNLGGDVFDCKYAGHPEGCGNTTHCRTCSIRNTIEDTLQSGKSNIKIPAYPDLCHVTGDKKIRFLITTEKFRESVLLRIDDVTAQ